MDRISFFSSLPCFIPLESKTWPPQPLHQDEEEKEEEEVVVRVWGIPVTAKKPWSDSDYQQQQQMNGKIGSSVMRHVPLVPLVVSTELVVASTTATTHNERSRVLYFATPTNSSHTAVSLEDPTLTTIEMAVIQSTSSTSSTTATTPTAVYFRFQQESVFLVTHSAMAQMSAVLVLSTTTTTSTTATTTTPTSVVLQFPHCPVQLRIFAALPTPSSSLLLSPPSERNNNDDTMRMTELFQSLIDCFPPSRRDCTSTGMCQRPTPREIAAHYRLSNHDPNCNDTNEGPSMGGGGGGTSSTSTSSATTTSSVVPDHQVDVVLVLARDDRTKTTTTTKWTWNTSPI